MLTSDLVTASPNVGVAVTAGVKIAVELSDGTVTFSPPPQAGNNTNNRLNNLLIVWITRPFYASTCVPP